MKGSTSAVKHSWVVKVEEELNKLKVEEELNKLENITQTDQPLMNKKNAIYRRPFNVWGKQDSSLYTPCIMSFGPYHHDDISCQQSNEMKENVLVHWLNRSSKDIHEYLDDLKKVVEDLKDAYNELDPKSQQDHDAFLKLMIYDGCFLLEILHEAEHLDVLNRIGHLFHEVLSKYAIGRNELIEYCRHDMLLIENQLPMQLLVKLVAFQKGLSLEEYVQIEAAQADLYKLILRFVAPSSPDIVEKLLRQDPNRTYLHVLDLYRCSLLYHEDRGESNLQSLQQTLNSWFNSFRESVASRKMNLRKIIFLLFLPTIFLYTMFLLPAVVIVIMLSYPPQFIRSYFSSKLPTDKHFIIPSTTELDKVGIGFKMNKTKSLMDISFESQALTLPQIYVNRATQSRFLNIIAFEQLHADAENEVTSYIYFMSRLLRVASDVSLLELHGIILTTLHNDEVVELFKSLTKDINVHDPNIFLVEEYQRTAKRLTENFCSKMKDAWQRELWQTYLKSPWAFISVVAAFFLFGIAALQTVYAVLRYYKHK